MGAHLLPQWAWSKWVWLEALQGWCLQYLHWKINNQIWQFLLKMAPYYNIKIDYYLWCWFSMVFFIPGNQEILGNDQNFLGIQFFLHRLIVCKRHTFDNLVKFTTRFFTTKEYWILIDLIILIILIMPIFWVRALSMGRFSLQLPTYTILNIHIFSLLIDEGLLNPREGYKG